MSEPKVKVPGHKIFELDDGVIFSSNFDNGNLAGVEKGNRNGEYLLWTAPDNYGSTYQSGHCAWFHFVVSGLQQGTVLKLRIMNASNHGGLYKHDMRPVWKSMSGNKKWSRLRLPVKFSKVDGGAHLYFEHTIDLADDKIYFAFTYPYTYTMVQDDLADLESKTYDIMRPDDIFTQREIVTTSADGLNVDLVTITSCEGADLENREDVLPGLFPNYNAVTQPRPPTFPSKETVFLSCRVHPGEVPAQHTFKGMFDFLLDPKDLRAIALRKKFVFKLVPLLNPDGVYRGHFRMDQFGNNLNRYYTAPNPNAHPTIYAAKLLLELYATKYNLGLYIDCHAHASKRGCFIYGNVLDDLDDQVQNQLFCQLIAMNTPHFDYEGCLFSREHMARIDPGDATKGLTAEGSGRVATYLNHGLVHSYTIESNYNTSKSGNEVSPTSIDPLGPYGDAAGSAYTPNPEKYSTYSWHGVGRACLIALLDIRGLNPASRLPMNRMRTLENLRQRIMNTVKNRKEYRQRNALTTYVVGGRAAGGGGKRDLHQSTTSAASMWRRSITAERQIEVPSSSSDVITPASSTSTPRSMKRPEVSSSSSSTSTRGGGGGGGGGGGRLTQYKDGRNPLVSGMKRGGTGTGSDVVDASDGKQMSTGSLSNAVASALGSGIGTMPALVPLQQPLFDIASFPKESEFNLQAKGLKGAYRAQPPNAKKDSHVVASPALRMNANLMSISSTSSPPPALLASQGNLTATTAVITNVKEEKSMNMDGIEIECHSFGYASAAVGSSGSSPNHQQQSSNRSVRLTPMPPPIINDKEDWHIHQSLVDQKNTHHLQPKCPSAQEVAAVMLAKIDADGGGSDEKKHPFAPPKRAGASKIIKPSSRIPTIRRKLVKR